MSCFSLRIEISRRGHWEGDGIKRAQRVQFARGRTAEVRLRIRGGCSSPLGFSEDGGTEWLGGKVVLWFGKSPSLFGRWQGSYEV